MPDSMFMGTDVSGCGGTKCGMLHCRPCNPPNLGMCAPPTAPEKPKRVILLNGPPGVGKDTLAAVIEAMGQGTQVSFKEHLIAIALVVSGVTRDDWDAYVGDRVLKETPSSTFAGLSPRQFLIKVSEEWVKPLYDDKYFGHRLAEKLSHVPGDAVVSDSGFASEVQPLVDAGYDVHIVRLHRFDYDFDGDSRGYLYKVAGVKGEYDVDITVDEPEATAMEALKAVGVFGDEVSGLYNMARVNEGLLNLIAALRDCRDEP